MTSHLMYLGVRVGAVALVWCLLFLWLGDPDTSGTDAMGAGMMAAFRAAIIFLVVFVGFGLLFTVEALACRRRGLVARMWMDIGLAAVLLGAPLVLFALLLLLD